MKTNQIKFQWLFAFVLGIFMASCSADEASTDAASASTYADEVVTRTQTDAKLGQGGCYELVFPVTLTFADGTTVSVDSYDGMKAAIKDWRTNNPKTKVKPTIAFPYDVINASGEIITVTSIEDQTALREACEPTGMGGGCGVDSTGNGGNGHGGNGGPGHGGPGNGGPKDHKPCFEPTYPYSVAIPDGTVITLNSKDDNKVLKDAVKAWKIANPTSTDRPTLVFPIIVQMKDGTLVTVNSADELKALKDSCK